ncbi:hypothetical protein QQ25_07025 [Mycolicibacterium setense]|nr:hypothetical protein QQ25_07025 [Mycolicibacterium setense]
MVQRLSLVLDLLLVQVDGFFGKFQLISELIDLAPELYELAFYLRAAFLQPVSVNLHAPCCIPPPLRLELRQDILAAATDFRRPGIAFPLDSAAVIMATQCRRTSITQVVPVVRDTRRTVSDKIERWFHVATIRFAAAVWIDFGSPVTGVPRTSNYAVVLATRSDDMSPAVAYEGTMPMTA